MFVLFDFAILSLEKGERESCALLADVLMSFSSRFPRLDYDTYCGFPGHIFLFIYIVYLVIYNINKQKLKLSKFNNNDISASHIRKKVCVEDLT